MAIYGAEFDLDMKVVQRKEFQIPDHLMIHDWAFTDSYYVLFSNRIKLDLVGNVHQFLHFPINH